MGCHTWFYRRGFKSDRQMVVRRRIGGHWYIDDTKRPVPLKTQFGEVEYYHDLFRIGGYPDITLHSKKECMKFIKDNNITEVHLDDLNEFWDLYPDGMIDFG